jgi:hypothetical protein
LAELGRLWPRLTRPRHGATPQLSAADRCKPDQFHHNQTLQSQGPTSKLAFVQRTVLCGIGMQTTALLCFSVFGRAIQQPTE